MNAKGRGSNVFSRTKPIILLTGLVMVALGIAVLVNPIAAVEALVRIMGWIMAAYGVVTIVSAFMRGDPLQNARADLVLGVITLIPGLIMGVFPGQLVRFVWTIIGIIVLATGILDIIEAGDFRRVGSPLALPATISGVITALLGLVVIISPMFSMALGMLFAAVALIVDGLTEIIFGLGA